jgi:hypothetical protein
VLKVKGFVFAATFVVDYCLPSLVALCIISFQHNAIDEVVLSQKSAGTVKSSRCKARKSEGMKRTYLYAAMTEDAA